MKRLWPLYSIAELSDLPEPRWLIGGHVTDGLTVLYGPPGRGKTFLALAWALALASGRDWLGHPVPHEPVLYVSGEGGGGISRRIHAWTRTHSNADPQMYVVIGTVVLTDRPNVEALREDIVATGAKLVIIDTLARSMSGADENSAQDMGLVINGLDWIRRQTGCGALVVHHSGVERTRPRGSTALFGAADTLIRVEGEGSTVDVVCEKQKESKPFVRVSLELRDIGSSCVLIPAKRATGFIPGGSDV